MIKINLLPQYVFEKEAVRRWLIIFGVLLVFVLAAGFGWRLNMNANLASLNEQLSEAQMKEQQVRDLQQKVVEELAKIVPVLGKVRFIEEVMNYNTKPAALCEELVRFTYEKIRYRQITLAGPQMEIDAYAPSISDAGRYLLNLYRAAHIFSSVSMSGVPNYGGSQAAPGSLGAVGKPKGFDFKITCVLTQPLTAPTYGAGAVAGAAQVPGAAAVPPPAPPPAQGGAGGMRPMGT